MIRLREATSADADAIAEVFTASRGLLTFLPRLHTPDEDRAFIAHRIVPEYRLTLAEDWCFKQNFRGRTFYAAQGFEALYETDGSGNEERAPDVRYRWER